MPAITLLLTLLACGGATPEPAPTTAGSPPASTPTAPTALNARSEIPVTEYDALKEKGFTLIDVREPDEWATGHLPGAIHIPLAQIDPKHPKIHGLPKDAPIYLVCASGRRSGEAADRLASAGYTTVNLAGGTKGWIEAGLPIQTP